MQQFNTQTISRDAVETIVEFREAAAKIKARENSVTIGINKGLLEQRISSERQQLLGNIICYRRTALGMTQTDLAARLGCSLSTISLLESGTSKDYRIFFFKRVAELLQIDTFILIGILLNDLSEEQIEAIHKILDIIPKKEDRINRAREWVERIRCRFGFEDFQVSS